MIVLDGKISRGDATRALNEGKKVSERGDGNIYIADIVVTDFTAIDAKRVEMQAEYDIQEYARNRATEYPAIADQLDEIYHNGIDSWRALIKVTKDKFPKG